MHLHCNLCTGCFGCGPGNCGTMGANLTIWPASFQRHSPQCDHQSPLRSLTLRANSSSTLPLSSSNRTKSFPTKNPHTHTDLLILVVWQRFPTLPLCCLCCCIESKPIAQSREGSSLHSISWSGNGQSQSTSDQNSWRKNQAIQAVTAKVQSKAKQIVAT